MSHSRNANRTWETPGPATLGPATLGPRARPGRAARKPALEPREPDAAAHDAGRQPHGGARGLGLHPEGVAYRVACRLFPGFAELPAGFRASLDVYAPLFAAAHGPLSLREREAIARAVAGREGDGFGAPDESSSGADARDAAGEVRPDDDVERERLIAAFAVKVTRRWLAIEGRDVERLLDAGVPASGIRAIAETAAVFHFLAEVSSAMRLRPRLTSGGRAPIAGVASRDPSWRELGRWLA